VREAEAEPVPANPDGTVGNNGDFEQPVPHPLNTLLGLSLPKIERGTIKPLPSR